jgi:hypothetical protein
MEMMASKSENLLFAGLSSKKGQAKLALFWCKGKRNPLLSVRSCRGALRAPVSRYAADGLRAHAVRPYDNRAGWTGFAGEKSRTNRCKAKVGLGQQNAALQSVLALPRI